MAKKKGSCYKCEKRTVEPNCHMTCKDHLDEVAEKREENKARSKALNSYASLFGNCNCKAGRTKGRW